MGRRRREDRRGEEEEYSIRYNSIIYNITPNVNTSTKHKPEHKHLSKINQHDSYILSQAQTQI